MKVYTLVREQLVRRPLKETFDFFADPNNLEAITPAWLKFSVVSTPAELQAGSRIVYRLKWHGISLRWKTDIEVWEPPIRFVDSQKSGPYALWRHTHTFVAQGEDTLTTDHVDYAIHLGPMGMIAHAAVVKRDVEAIFNYRRERIAELLDRGSPR